jgi:hypothetical protein
LSLAAQNGRWQPDEFKHVDGDLYRLEAQARGEGCGAGKMRTQGIESRDHLGRDRSAIVNSLNIDHDLVAARHHNGCCCAPAKPARPEELGEYRVRLDLFGRLDIKIGVGPGVRLGQQPSRTVVAGHPSARHEFRDVALQLGEAT